ncbi:MAG: o-succinylbenzoate synthase [Aquirufa sp.]
MAKFDIEVIKYCLDFHFEAGTSRGILTHKNSYFLKISDPKNPNIVGIGEAGPLKGLSPEFEEDCTKAFQEVITKISNVELPTQLADIPVWLQENEIKQASFRMAIEMAIRDFIIQKNGIYFDNTFSRCASSLPINGLIWMGAPEFMESQIEDKLKQGYNCLKLKIGAIDFETELSILKKLRSRFSKEELTIRVDANGAFEPKDAAFKLEKLQAFDLHSIEQPIKAGHWDEMAELITKKILPIALDEELIGIQNPQEQEKLLASIQPEYIIIKPSLLGGFAASEGWIQLAKKQNIDWWITSALESNIGLQAIAQFTAEFDIQMPQGLGTGQLYTNNFDSGLSLHKGQIYFDSKFKRKIPFAE